MSVCQRWLSTIQKDKRAEATDDFLNESMIWATIAVILTVYALFIDDLRLLYFPKSSDNIIVTVNWIIMAIFLLEWLADSVVRPEYAGSLTSWLDLLAALSLVPATEFMQDETSVARIARTFRALRILRATRAAAMALKTEDRAKRVSIAQNLKIRRRESYRRKENDSSGNEEDDEEDAENSRSILEGILLERSNVKMLLGVLVLLLGTSLIDYTETDRVGKAGLELVELQSLRCIDSTSCDRNITDEDLSMTMKQYKLGIEYDADGYFMNRRLIYVSVADHVLLPDSNVTGAATISTGATSTTIETYESLMLIRRATEIDIIVSKSGRSIAKIDMKPLYDVMNWYSISLTFFCIIVIVFWANSFRQDYTQFVLKPLKEMTDFIQEMTTNPLEAIKKSEELMSVDIYKMK